jgi:hypothetical protein
MMGLDQYAFARRGKLPAPVDFDEESGENTQLQYWRKHPNLHGWMEKLYRSKGGAASSFNVVPVELTAEDLEALEKDIRDAKLPSTSGFFFGQSDGSEFADDLKFIQRARASIEAGNSVFYTSWW